jgi:hypothetical protein
MNEGVLVYSGFVLDDPKVSSYLFLGALSIDEFSGPHCQDEVLFIFKQA